MTWNRRVEYSRTGPIPEEVRVVEQDRKREDEWFLENERQLLETARQARLKREQERAAKELGLGNFVALDGYVGVIGNGAGLTMSTLDVVAEAGGKPANFLDIGGGANALGLKS